MEGETVVFTRKEAHGMRYHSLLHNDFRATVHSHRHTWHIRSALHGAFELVLLSYSHYIYSLTLLEIIFRQKIQKNTLSGAQLLTQYAILH